VLSLVFRVEAMHTNDGTWKYTSLLICAVVENDVAIIVSCTPGFVNFTRIYISELPIVKSLRSTLGGSSNGVSGFSNKLLRHQKVDPNKPRTRNGSRKENHEFDVLSDTFTKSTSLTEGSEGECSISRPPVSNSPGIVRTVEVSQETHYPGFMPATEAQPKIQNYPTGVFHYGPGTVQPPAQSVWFYYVPSSNQQAGGAYNISDHGPRTYASGNYPFRTSTEGLVLQRPGEP
jgi:hypothetical protein